MDMIYGAEEHNWLLGSRGLIKVIMTENQTTVVFDSHESAVFANNDLDNYEIPNHVVNGNIIVLSLT